nr:BREX-1 system adenine-specific DNA-methyltransferase PglX [Moraxella sp.]
MNTNNIKAYAPKARIDFINAVSSQAQKYGITADSILPADKAGDMVKIGDAFFPPSIIQPRDELLKRIEKYGYDSVIEFVAYSWFNRLCAIRYMELKGFLEHGRRVLSSADGSAGIPQIVDDALNIDSQDLPDLDKEKVRELKLAGDKDEELYRLLLISQCHALHRAMPFLFEKVGDATELLLPDNLTKTDSLIRDLVSSIPEENWENIEIIGWLYQFYIAEKKDEVIGKVVASEDIPAATQLFTPNWIVQYMVQNSVGRQWLQSHPYSGIKSIMPYYIEPAEQSEEVNAELAQMVNPNLKPEDIKIIDPASGSGHILVEAYRLLKAIYEENNYRSREIPQSILNHNLYGLDIDDRAGQLTGFALMMLAREDDSRIFSRDIRLNVMSLQEPKIDELPELWLSLSLNGEWDKGQSGELFGAVQANFAEQQSDSRYHLLDALYQRFAQAKTFGSLIDVSDVDIEELNKLYETLLELSVGSDNVRRVAAEKLLPIVHQAVVLAGKYDAVIANPPYLGGSGIQALKEFSKRKFPNSKSDLFAMFIERGFEWCKEYGFNAMVTMHGWMFLSSYEKMRTQMLEQHSISSMLHLGARAFPEIGGEVVQTTAFVIFKKYIRANRGVYFRLVDEFESSKEKNVRLGLNRYDEVYQEKFKNIIGSPVAYWANENIRNTFKNNLSIKDKFFSAVGLQTGDNSRFLRIWYEVNIHNIGFNIENRDKAKRTGKRWFPYNKGGEFRKWYGNQDYVVNWKDDGFEIRNIFDSKGKQRSRPQNTEFYFKPSISWSFISSSNFGVRYYPQGFIFDVAGSSIFPKDDNYDGLTGFLCTPIAPKLMKILNPTHNSQVGNIEQLPYINIENNVTVKCIEISKQNWDSYETSWEFTQNPLIRTNQPTLQQAYTAWHTQNTQAVADMKHLEEENNRLFINAYGLQDELTPDVPDDQITLTRADATADSQRLISYIIGCIMGRYSLDEQGLVYAHAGNQDFDPTRYSTFPADDDGIVPITDQEWFSDDATNRIKEFIRTVWGEETEAQNLEWLADQLGTKGDTSSERIRNYLSSQFYKDHLKTYKKRPVYWLFSSGKLKGFECLVYMHRYHVGTLARMRTDYVLPLLTKMKSEVQRFETQKLASHSASDTKRLERQITGLNRQYEELSKFDEKLKHLADQRISIDLDDGVKVNYGKFGDLLANVKDIAGAKGD